MKTDFVRGCFLVAPISMFNGQLGTLQVLIDMDRRDEESGKMEEIYQQLHSAYYQFTLTPHDLFKSGSSSNHEGGDSVRDPENVKPGLIHPTLGRLPLSGIKDVITWLFLLFTFQERNKVK